MGADHGRSFTGFGLLEGLGVYGCGAIEDVLLAGLLQGDPVLLVGGPGCAKTHLVEMLAESMNTKFWAYDAGKALFEDVIGFLDPRGLNNGRVEYLQTDLSIWGKQFILLDELSRANPGMQSKWLEVIRSRRIMGKPLDELMYVVAAMNPPGMMGTLPLDEALAGRFTFIIRMPEVGAMQRDDRVRVIENAGRADSIALGQSQHAEWPRIATVLDRARQLYKNVEKELGEEATRYVDGVGTYLNHKNVKMDGRRLGMLRRGILATAAIRRELSGNTPGESNDELFRHVLDNELPFFATGQDVEAIVIHGAHEHGLACSKGVERKLSLPDRFDARARVLIADAEARKNQDASSLLVTRICTTLERPEKFDRSIRAMAAMLLLMADNGTLLSLRPEARHRLLLCFRDYMDDDAPEEETFIRRRHLKGGGGSEDDGDLGAERPMWFIRVAENITRRLNEQPIPNVSIGDVLGKLENALRARG